MTVGHWAQRVSAVCAWCVVRCGGVCCVVCGALWCVLWCVLWYVVCGVWCEKEALTESEREL